MCIYWKKSTILRCIMKLVIFSLIFLPQLYFPKVTMPMKIFDLNRYRSYFIGLQLFYSCSSAMCRIFTYLLSRHLIIPFMQPAHLHNIHSMNTSSFTQSLPWVFLQKILSEREESSHFITSQYQTLSLPLGRFVTFLGSNIFLPGSSQRRLSSVPANSALFQFLFLSTLLLLARGANIPKLLSLFLFLLFLSFLSLSQIQMIPNLLFITWEIRK